VSFPPASIIPLRDLRIQIPACIIQPRVGLDQLRQPRPNIVEVHALQRRHRNDDIRDLHARVVDVILYTRLEPRLVFIGLQHPRKAVAQDRVSQMPDVRCLVRIDARMLDQPKARTADHCVLIRSHPTNHARAIELHIQIARTGDLHRSYTRRIGQRSLQLLRNRSRRLLQPLGQLERHRHRHLAELDLRR
jgi:hypothetical protein